MSDWSFLSSLRSFFTNSTGNTTSQDEFGSNAESLSKASALASAFVAENGVSPEAGHLTPLQSLTSKSPFAVWSGTPGATIGSAGLSAMSPVGAGGSGASSGTALSATTVTTEADGSVLVGAAGGLQFHLVWDSSVSTAPAGFETAAIAAASFYTQMFKNSELITIDVGWNECNGSVMGTSALSESQTTALYKSYSTVEAALKTDAGQSANQAQADATLTASDPLGARLYYVPTAEAKAIGLLAPGSTYVDGHIGMSSAFSWDFNAPTTPVGAGQYDAIGALEHEISEVMGRTSSVGLQHGPAIYTPLDLFRYTSPGARDTTVGPTSPYFSINGGVTNLGVYNNGAKGGDLGDWVSSIRGDSYGYGSPGTSLTVSATDLIENSVLGYNLTAAGLAATHQPGLA